MNVRLELLQVWKRVSHPNVLMIEGVAPDLFEFCMVSQWMVHSNILDYTEKHAGADRLELVCLLRVSMTLVGAH